MNPASRSDEHRQVGWLALLVGSNPLPNYLAARILRPSEVVLIYSPETCEPCDRLRAALSDRDQATRVEEVCIDDATDARKIRDACQGLQVDHLHYSGGTKTMAAHARMAFGLAEAQASYLDERKGLLRFDDGYDIRLENEDLDLTLDLVLDLHGIKGDSAEDKEGAPTEGDVEAIAKAALCKPELVQQIRDALRPHGKRRGIREAKKSPWTPDADVSLSVNRVPDENWTNSRYEVWDDFLNGGWLEQWTAHRIRDCVGDSPRVEVGVVCQRQGPSPVKFEIDVAMVRGHRLHVISCTTDRTKGLCKSKLFEVAMRARQMGGDLARCALVCLLDGRDDKGPYVEQLRADIASLWDAPNVPAVFGLADLREWEGVHGSANLSTLRAWLER